MTSNNHPADMSSANTASADHSSADTSASGGNVAARSAPGSEDAVLPELRASWWETGMRARIQSGIWTVFTELPGLVAAAMRISWRADRVRTSVVAVTTLLSGVLASFSLLATQRVLVELFAAGPTPHRVMAAVPALAALATATGLRAGLSIATGYAQNGLAPRVDREAERALFETTTAVRLEAFDGDAFADDMERATRGSNSVNGLVEAVMDLLAGLVGLVAVTVAVVVIHPLLLLALLVATLPGGWASLRAGHLRYQTYLAGSVRRRRLWLLQRLMAERRTAAELRAYDLRRFLLGQYDRVMGVETRIELELARRVATTTAVGSLIGGVATGGVYALLGVLLLRGQIPLAAAATCVVAVQVAQRSLSTVTIQLDRIYTEGKHFSDYAGFLDRAASHLPDADAEADTTDRRPTPGPLRRIRLRRVGLTYSDRETPAIAGVSLTIEAGQTIALVGENGSGKSTLAAVIAGLRSPDEGTVEWNGRPLPEWDPAGLRARIAVVSQDYYRWPFTAATNIALGDVTAEADRARIEAASALATAHDTIQELPKGYETLLDRTFEGGQDLSGGQWQRITAARGFLRDADLLIMDEPSAALDPRSEDALFQAIRGRQGLATTILITHRLANVRHADRIYLLHHGVLVEAGSHDELVAAAGRYAELFALQAAGYLGATSD